MCVWTTCLLMLTFQLQIHTLRGTLTEIGPFSCCYDPDHRLLHTRLQPVLDTVRAGPLQVTHPLTTRLGAVAEPVTCCL